MDTRGMGREDLETLWRRLLRVARLDATAFLEVRDDPRATIPALAVVVVASFLSGIGGWLRYLFTVHSLVSPGGQFFINSVLIGTILAAACWLAWVAVTLFMLRQIWRRRVDFSQLVRTMGLAYFPVAISILLFIKGLSLPVGMISLAAAVLLSGVAVEASVEAEAAEVLFANLLGFAVFAIILGLFGYNGFPNPLAPGIFAFSF